MGPPPGAGGTGEGAAAVNPYQHLGEEREEESARSWAQPQGCDGMGWARLGWTGHTMLALGSPGTRQCQLAADLLLAGVTQLGLSSTQQQGDEVGAQARAGAEGWCWGGRGGCSSSPQQLQDSRWH